MFESVTRDPGAEGLDRASRIFYVIAALITLSTVLLVVLGLTGGRGIRPVGIVVNLIFGVVAFVTGKGISEQRTWAKWIGIGLGIVELFNFPIGTVIGIAVLVYLRRAIKAGLFKSVPSSAA